MSKKLPPLVVLEAFEAAARLGNFSKAAALRHMTHSGISRHVQTLEHWCGQALFDRNGPKVSLNDAGRALLQRVADPLDQLYQALQTPRARSEAVPLHLLVLPSFANTWLVPRLQGFLDAHPHIALSLHAGYEVTSIPPFGTTVALRYGEFARDGLVSERLFGDALLPVASKKFLAAHGADPATWPAHKLLRHHQVPWPARLRSTHDGRTVRIKPAAGVEMNDALLLLQAARAGMGLVWARQRLVQAAGHRDLVALTEWQQTGERAYWITHRAELSEHPAVRAFKAWVLQQAQVDTHAH